MNILRYKQKAQGWMPRDDTSDETNTTPTTTWSDPLGSVTTTPSTGGITWNNTNGTSGQYTDPKLTPDTPPATPPQEQPFALNKQNFDNNNPNFVQGLSQAPQMQKTLSQLYSGYTTGSDQNVQNQDQADRSNMLAGQTTAPSWAQAHGIIPGMTSEQYFNQQTPAERTGIMTDIGNGIHNVGNALFSLAMPAPIRAIAGGINAYNAYQKDPSTGAGTAIANGLTGLGGRVATLANLYNGNYGSAVTGGLRTAGITGMPASLAGVGADYATGKNIAPSLGGLAGQFAGNSLGGSVGGAFGQSLGQSMARSSSLRK